MTQYSAILSTAIVGYSRLMRMDETRAAASLKRIRAEIVDIRLARHRGSIIKAVDDRLVIAFDTCMQAVAFAIDMQIAMRERNKKRREDRQIHYRIGIEAVTDPEADTGAPGGTESVAGGLSELAFLGGVCISGLVHDDITPAADLNFDKIVERRVKIHPEPDAVYDVVLDEKAAAFVDAPPKVRSKRQIKRTTLLAAAAALVLILVGAGGTWMFLNRNQATVIPETLTDRFPNRPSIAVLPFDNLSMSDEGNMIADGMTASIISALADVPEIFVISRNSINSYKDQPVDVRQVGQDLNVAYVVDGTVQLSGDNARILVELADTLRGENLWTGRYDRHVGDLFSLQDEIALRVLVSLQVQLTEGYQAAVRGASTDNVDAYLALMKAETEFSKYSRQGSMEARRLIKEVLALDPRYREAYLLEARTYIRDAQWGYSEDPTVSLQKAADLLEQAAALDEQTSDAERAELDILNAYIDQVAGRYEAAMEKTSSATELDPNNSFVLALAGFVASFNRQYDKSIELIDRAMLINPVYPSWYSLYLSRDYAFKGDVDQAVEWALDAVSRAENDNRRAWTLVNLAFVYDRAGRPEDAAAAAAEALALSPDLTISGIEDAQPYSNPEDWDQLTAALVRAGIPER